MDVPAADGVPLHVEIDGQGPVTVVLAHGWTLDATTWAPVARSLDARVVRYDHRGHGRSAAVDPASMTIDQLADDLAAVIAAVAPEGPLVLAGHSMGGMAIMALAERHPGVAARAQGIAPGRDGRGRARGPPARPSAARRRRPRARGARGCSPRPGGPPGPRSATPACSRRGCAGSCSARTPTPRRGGSRWRRWRAVVRARSRASGRPSTAHERAAALAAFAHTPTVVLAGTRDRLTPVPMARRIAEALPVGAAHGVPRRRAHAAGGAHGGRGRPPGHPRARCGTSADQREARQAAPRQAGQ